MEDAKQEVRAKPLQKERSGLPRATTGIRKALPRKHKHYSRCDTKILPQPRERRPAALRPCGRATAARARPRVASRTAARGAAAERTAARTHDDNGARRHP